MRVVASLTTMPDRYDKVVRTVRTIAAQTYPLDAIYLGLPTHSRRLNIPYPEISPELKKLVTVVPCTDFGPITKLMCALLVEQDPDTVIITFDDDMLYNPRTVETLMERHKQYPNSALGSSGMLLRYNCPMCAITPNQDTAIFRMPKFHIPDEGRRVDSIYGYSGALYVRKFFPCVSELEEKFLNYALDNNDSFMNDDIVISGYLSMQGIERRIFCTVPVVNFLVEEDTGIRNRTTNEISYDLDKFFQRMNRAIDHAKSIGMYSTTEDVSVTETIFGLALVAFLSILAVGFVIYYMLIY